MAIFRIITFLIHAILGAIASLLASVFTHLVPALIAIAAIVALTMALFAGCGLSGAALLRRRQRD